LPSRMPAGAFPVPLRRALALRGSRTKTWLRQALVPEPLVTGADDAPVTFLLP